MIYRNKKLLETCRLIPCQICGIDDGTVCASHSNQQCHGKGTGIKASDAMVASLCYNCHFDIDNGFEYSKQERKENWDSAYMRTMRNLIERGFLVVA